MKFHQYSSLISTDVEYIGNIPKHWDVSKRFRHIFQVKKGKNPSVQETENKPGYLPYLSATYLRDKEPDFWVPNEGLRATENDILLLWDGSNAGEFFSSKVGVVGSTFALLSTNVKCKKYFWYLMKSYEQYIKDTSVGMGIPHVNGDALKNLYVLIPEELEQQTIASFLDRETAKIDKLIQRQEKLIELIQEKQKSTILNHVIYGTKVNIDLKESSNDWLKNIPAHWGEGNLKVLSKIYSGGTPDKLNEGYWANGSIPWLNSGSVNDFYIYEPSEYITEDALRNSSAKWIKKGSVLVALAGQGKTKGMAAQLMFDSTCNQSMCAIVPNEELDGNYLLWWLSANYQNIRNMAGGDLRDGLNLEMIGKIKCPMPPLNEQRAISNYLNELRDKNLALIDKCKSSIELLKEHRTSLIYAAVTGKINAREFV